MGFTARYLIQFNPDTLQSCSCGLTRSSNLHLHNNSTIYQHIHVGIVHSEDVLVKKII